MFQAPRVCVWRVSPSAQSDAELPMTWHACGPRAIWQTLRLASFKECFILLSKPSARRWQSLSRSVKFMLSAMLQDCTMYEFRETSRGQNVTCGTCAWSWQISGYNPMSRMSCLLSASSSPPMMSLMFLILLHLVRFAMMNLVSWVPLTTVFNELLSTLCKSHNKSLINSAVGRLINNQ